MKGSAAVRVGGFARRAAGYIVVGMFGLIGAIMVVSTAVRGQALTAVALATLWLVPPVWVALRCRRGGRGVEPLLWAVLGLVCAASVVAAVTAQAWWDFANEEGPYFQVLVLVVGVCLAIWSLREPVRGGIAMIVLGVIPVMTLALVPGTSSSFLVGSIGPVVLFAVAGLACLIGRRLERAGNRPAATPTSLRVGVPRRDQGGESHQR